MSRRRLAAAALAAVALVVVLVGVRQELLTVAPGYEATVTTGWGGPLNHEERLLERLSALAAVGAVAAVRWRRLAAVPVAVAGVLLFYTVRAVAHHASDPGLYTEVVLFSGDRAVFTLGAEPAFLTAGGLLFLAAGVVAWRSGAVAEPADASEPSAA